MKRALSATGAALPPDWAVQAASDNVDVPHRAAPAAPEDAGVDPAEAIGIATDFNGPTRYR